MKKKTGQSPRYFENDKYEKFLGVDTTEVVYNNRYNDDYARYEPTCYSGLICAFDEMEPVMTKYDRLVDFGCGKGRVLFYVHQRFQCEVCGVEVDQTLYEIALDNRAYFNTRFRGALDKVELICGKAEEYEVQREDTVFYFFNPFVISIFSQVIDHILESVARHPRRIFVMMYYPTEDYRQYMKEKHFKFYGIAKLPAYEMDWDEKVLIYEFGGGDEI